MGLKSKTMEIVKYFEFKFNKNLGQNFLIDENILKKIIDAAELDENSTVIEIGPGIGTLTQEMAKRCKKVVAVEIDKNLIPILEETLGNFKNIKIIHSDALKVDFNKIIKEENLENVKVVANLPYYVTTPIIAKLLNERVKISSMIIMIQKEVADRILAKPNTDEYGTLSLLCQYHCDIKKICKVSPNCFVPPPRVESMVIRLDIRDQKRVEVLDEELFFNIIKSAFNMRRKTLSNSLKSIANEDILLKALEELSIDPKRRGETLSIEEFAKLSNILSKQKS
ncbi:MULTISPECIES: 16S rRNA (adenine(1518)-N(6)/adenine(1519)-N(6))-dimethyltransferase RsmA [Caloramator]|uniref:Ribosomal RNA small subunit methyltransferase A n=1 Tax=Caloramator australicus RC3 TaxID=857293 RepID=I7K9Z4_9CLOT|nr:MULTISPECIES: 16S rRNA (adenine(1518)-N(6)/adenine(1519)-N(6))-dimethyltransferase RsmA [Caloramator]MDO6355922.1 16S rRNA (adenine(1518)-N(6)/adenine(1519)-N(6))-dimethyltransferase RsmA [Caloramator sp. CAR-1]CCJ34497.1 Dimethyladenosine transferase [Caloramator australicus RC3]